MATNEEILEATLNSITSLEDVSHEPSISNAGLLYLSLNQPEEALGMFRAAVKLNDGRDSSWFNIGVIEESLGTDDDTVLEAYNKALETTKSKTVASACFNNIFELLFRAKRYEEAAQWADSALKNLPEDPRAWFNVGVVMRESGNFEWAASCLEKAAREFPGDDGSQCLALTNLADVYIRLGQLPAALQCYRDAVAVDPTDADSFYNMALLLRDDMHDDEGAQRALETCVELKPNHPQAVFQLAALSLSIVDEGESGDSTVLRLPRQAPADYVAGLFDHYAGVGYDQHLLQDLEYKGHEFVVSSLLNAAAAGDGGRERMAALLGAEAGGEVNRILDLGCGTGLVGRTFRACGALSTLEGCDLSVKMVEAARARQYERRRKGGENKVTCKVYERVEQQDCETFLHSVGNASVHAILAGDVLCYFGVLDNLLTTAARVLRPGGLFSFTVEKLEESEREAAGAGGFLLRKSARYAHSREAVMAAAGRAGLEVMPEHGETEVILRLQGGEPVRGTVFVLIKQKQ